MLWVSSRLQVKIANEGDSLLTMTRIEIILEEVAHRGGLSPPCPMQFPSEPGGGCDQELSQMRRLAASTRLITFPRRRETSGYRRSGKRRGWKRR